ncbi:MAG: SDR family oxidoreductase [Pseudomonadota bacterium]|nr:SDR family oxidoreductase [Pseudomonadota bacterium]
MKLLVFGASGRTGHELVKQALAGGLEVTAFVRNPAKLRITSPNLRVVQGDVGDQSAVEHTVGGHDAVVSALGVGKTLKHDPVVIDGIRHIIRAMEGSSVRRLIYLSFIGVRESRHAAGFFLRYIAPVPLRQEIEDHQIKEGLIRASRLDWTVVRAPNLTNGPLTGIYRVGEDISAHSLFPRMSRADVAHFMLRQLTDTTFVRKTPRVLPYRKVVTPVYAADQPTRGTSTNDH